MSETRTLEDTEGGNWRSIGSDAFKMQGDIEKLFDGGFIVTIEQTAPKWNGKKYSGSFRVKVHRKTESVRSAKIFDAPFLDRAIAKAKVEMIEN